MYIYTVDQNWWNKHHILMKGKCTITTLQVQYYLFLILCVEYNIVPHVELGFTSSLRASNWEQSICFNICFTSSWNQNINVTILSLTMNPLTFYHIAHTIKITTSQLYLSLLGSYIEKYINCTETVVPTHLSSFTGQLLLNISDKCLTVSADITRGLDLWHRYWLAHLEKWDMMQILLGLDDSLVMNQVLQTITQTHGSTDSLGVLKVREWYIIIYLFFDNLRVSLNTIEICTFIVFLNLVFWTRH